MPIRKKVRGMPTDCLAAEGILEMDFDAITPCQRECANWLGINMQMEHETYLSHHPEIRALLEQFLSEMTRASKMKNFLRLAADFFTRPQDVLDAVIRKRLNIADDESYFKKDKPNPFNYNNISLEFEIKQIFEKHYPTKPPHIPEDLSESPNTVSSSFLSIVTSDTTLPTPEPIPTPEPTLSENMFALVSNTVDKAIYSRVDEYSLRYDTAYVELMRAVENAMEVPVIEIREDLATLFFNAYKLFELDILEKERIAAEIAWEKRMRKKLKRTLRRQKNFKGFETPPTPKSVISSHESYKVPPPKPCVCAPKFNYNRYPKDRFGIYLPREVDFSEGNITVTPVMSVDSLTEGTEN